MKRLVNTQLFCLLKKVDGVFNFGEHDIRSVYEDFVHQVTNLCTSEIGDTPAYFTIHYTRLELERFQVLFNNKGAGKKCSNSTLYSS